MFKNPLMNHHLVIRLGRNTDEAPVELAQPAVDPEELSRIAKGLVKYTAIAAATVAGAAVVLNTLSQIAVIAAEANINKKED